MSGLLRILRRFLDPATQPDKVASSLGASTGLDLSRFAAGDRVLVDRKKLSGPLQHGQRHDTPRGFIPHNDIIGQPSVRSQIKTHTGHPFEISYPTLDEYVSLAPRKVTPVYASYASLIVSLLDIHVSPPPKTTPGPVIPALEILESGTGHGSLTLHISRAIAPANPPAPYPLPAPLAKPPSKPNQQLELHKTWSEYRKTRHAILHTVELSPTFQTHAEKLIRGFRQGSYWPHIDFYPVSVSEWISSQLSTRSAEQVKDGFLQHVVLDMPGVHKQIPSVVQAMKDDAMLLVFVPSVTQIGDCVREIQNRKLPLVMDKVVEMGEGISNGRVWDVRLVNLRKQASRGTKEVEIIDDEESTRPLLEDEEARIEPDIEGEPVFVCRPKVGRMTIGGGFVGVWRKSNLPMLSKEELRNGKPHKKLRRAALAKGDMSLELTEGKETIA